MMSRSALPARAADVAKPARSECPANARCNEADRRDGALHDQGDGAIGEARGSDVSVPIDSAKNGPLGNAGGVEPGAHGSHRANLRRGREGDREDAPAGFLIGLVAADGDREAFDVDEEIGHVETNESRATKRARPPEQEQRPIARAVERRRQRGERAAQLGDEERSGLALRGAELAADPAAHGADLGGVAG